MDASQGARCPSCRKTTRPRSENAFFPFCSRSCKLRDLGRWLDGSYRISEPADEASITSDDRPETSE
jgi:hypothetical protein